MGQLRISFMPSAENQAMGPLRGHTEGLQQAIRLLSLRLPKVVGAKAIADPSLLSGGGSAAFGGGFNPDSASMLALLKAMVGGDAASLSLPSAPPNPHVIPGVDHSGPQAFNQDPFCLRATAAATSVPPEPNDFRLERSRLRLL